MLRERRGREGSIVNSEIISSIVSDSEPSLGHRIVLKFEDLDYGGSSFEKQECIKAIEAPAITG